MPLIDEKQLLEHAFQNHYILPAIEIHSLSQLGTALQTAEHLHAPIALIPPATDAYQHDLALLIAAMVTAARRTHIAVALHMHHSRSTLEATSGINHGCNGISLQPNSEELGPHIEQTCELATMASGCGVMMEGLLPAALLSHVEDFVHKSGVDALCIDLAPEQELPAGLGRALGIPMVRSIDEPLTPKRATQWSHDGVAKVITPMTTPEELATTIQASGCQDLNVKLIESCQRWDPVDHLILFNVEGINEEQAHVMMTHGREVLSQIPGVLEVVCGEAVKQDASYRYSWVIRFCHPAVIESYKNHPDHMAFADNHFRPVAGGRVSVDYLPLP